MPEIKISIAENCRDCDFRKRYTFPHIGYYCVIFHKDIDACAKKRLPECIKSNVK